MKANLSGSNFSVVNEPRPHSYPISGYSWLLIHMRQSSAASGAALVQLVDWMTQTRTTPALSSSGRKSASKPVRLIEGDDGRKPYWLMEWPCCPTNVPDSANSTKRAVRPGFVRAAGRGR